MKRTSTILTASLLTTVGLAGSTAAQGTGTKVGQFFPDVALPTIDGERVIRLSDLRGKKLLLIEFAAW